MSVGKRERQLTEIASAREKLKEVFGRSEAEAAASNYNEFFEAQNAFVQHCLSANHHNNGFMLNLAEYGGAELFMAVARQGGVSVNSNPHAVLGDTPFERFLVKNTEAENKPEIKKFIIEMVRGGHVPATIFRLGYAACTMRYGFSAEEIVELNKANKACRAFNRGELASMEGVRLGVAAPAPASAPAPSGAAVAVGGDASVDGVPTKEAGHAARVLAGRNGGSDRCILM